MTTTILKTAMIAISSIALGHLAYAQDQDAEGCKDHPLFNRMPNYVISQCEQKEFDLIRFPVGPPDPKNENKIKSIDIEGKVTVIWYALKEGATRASGLQIMRNFQNAAQKYGGSILGEYKGWCAGHYDATSSVGSIPFGNGCTYWGTTLKFSKDGKEIYVYEQFGDDDAGYNIVIVERQEMKQDISANEMFEQLNSGQSLTLYINFETGKSTIKSESQPIVDEIYKMMKDNPSLKILIEGHTDNVGNKASNQTLSEQRAASVKTALVNKGIAADRINTVGYGQDKPIADNSTDEGRAKNRRVEIKKM